MGNHNKNYQFLFIYWLHFLEEKKLKYINKLDITYHVSYLPGL